MKKIVILLVATTLFSCQQKENSTSETTVQSATNENTEVAANTKEQVINFFLEQFNTIQENLNRIKEKQKIVTLSTKDGELKKTPQEQIISDIAFINELLDKNRQTIQALNEKVRQSNVKIDGLDKTIETLNNMIDEQDAEITFLKHKLSNLNIQLNNIDDKYKAELKSSEAKTEKLNRAYCAIGTQDELLKQNLILKKGGSIGIGKLEDVDPNLPNNMLSTINIYRTTDISIAARKVKLISDHAKGSYKITDRGSIKTLSINDPDEFWKLSRYLVIEISADEPED